MPPLVVGGLTSLGVSGAVAGPLANILFTGLSLILSILFAPEVPKPEDGRTPFKQPVPNRQRILGRRRTAGAYMLYHSYKGGTFFGVIAVCDGEVNEFSKFWLHDDEIWFVDGSPHEVRGIKAHGSSNRYGGSKVYIYWRYGLPTETSYISDVIDMGSLVADGVWTMDHRGDGIASACIRAADAGADNQAQRFPFGIPQLSVEVDATRVFDPRRQSMGTGSAFSSGPSGSFGGQDYRDPTTWTFRGNDNPILQVAWFLTAPVSQGGMGLDFAESFGTVLDDIAAQASICDEQVANKIGTENRYKSAALFKYSDDPSEVLAALLGTCDGFLAERGDGAFELKAGKWDDDDFAITLTDRHIISLHVTRFRPDEDEVTGVIVKYDSPEHGHQTIDAPVWPRDAYQGGEDRRIRTIEITYCPQARQAQRLSKRVALYEMATVRGTAVLNLYGLLLLDRRGCTIQCSDDPALADAKCRLTRLEVNLVAGTCEIDFTVFDPDEVDAWDAATEEGRVAPVVTVPIDDENSTPTSLVASAGTVGGALIIDLGFDPGGAIGNNDNMWVQYRLQDKGGGVPGPWATVLIDNGDIERPESDFWIISLTGLPAQELDIRCRANAGPYSALVSVDATAPTCGRPTAFTAVLNVADVDLAWTSPNSAGFDHARVYRATSGAGFGFATDISGPLAGSANSPMTYTDLAPTGPADYDYWVSAENATNVSSLPRGPETVAVP